MNEKFLLLLFTPTYVHQVRSRDRPDLEDVQKRPRTPKDLQRDFADAMEQERDGKRLVLHLPWSAQPPRLSALFVRCAPVELLTRAMTQALEEVAK